MHLGRNGLLRRFFVYNSGGSPAQLRRQSGAGPAPGVHLERAWNGAGQQLTGLAFFRFGPTEFPVSSV